MRRPALLLFALLPFLVVSPALSAQNAVDAKPAEEVPKFTSKTQLVLVPVVVTTKNGDHIGGLTREAFKIEEQGKVRMATVFEEVKTVAPQVKSPEVRLEGRSNFELGEGPSWRVTAVVLDMLNTPYLYQSEGRRRLIAYLSKALKREEPTALFGLRRSGLKQLHPFTTDTAVLIEALKKVRGEVGPDELGEQSAGMVSDTADLLSSQSSDETAQAIASFLNDQEATMNAFEQREAIHTTLNAMIQLAHAYAAIPGRKTLIWASGGFPFMIDDPQAFARMGADMFSRYEETWRALVAADVVVYTVDVTGLGGGATNTASGNFDARRSAAGRRPGGPMGMNPAVNIPYDKGAQKIATLRAFSESTGGLPCVNTNDLERCFARAVEDSREYYVLGYYLPADDQNPGWRKLKVKVMAEGAQVRAREGFYVPGPAEESTEARQRQIVEALKSPVEFTGVRLNVRELPPETDAKPAAAGKHLHAFSVGVLGSSIAVDAENGNAIDLSVVSVAFDARGKNGGQAQREVFAKLQTEMLSKVRKTGLSIRQEFELAPGKYDIHFAVRDNLSGEIGSVEYPLEVK